MLRSLWKTDKNGSRITVDERDFGKVTRLGESITPEERLRRDEEILARLKESRGVKKSD